MARIWKLPVDYTKLTRAFAQSVVEYLNRLTGGNHD